MLYVVQQLSGNVKYIHCKCEPKNNKSNSNGKKQFFMTSTLAPDMFKSFLQLDLPCDCYNLDYY